MSNGAVCIGVVASPEGRTGDPKSGCTKWTRTTGEMTAALGTNAELVWIRSDNASSRESARGAAGFAKTRLAAGLP
jgi:hypothetical protein